MAQKNARYAADSSWQRSMVSMPERNTSGISPLILMGDDHPRAPRTLGRTFQPARGHCTLASKTYQINNEDSDSARCPCPPGG